MSRRFSSTLCALILLGAAGCSRAVVVHPPRDHAAREARMVEALRTIGGRGDWLVIRGYHATDDLVATLTNAPFSHAAVLDPERGQVIEAEGVGIHTTPLADFVRKAQRLMLVHPMWAVDAERQAVAVTKARSLVGGKYDYSGLMGLNNPERYYCSELAVAVYRPYVKASDHVPPVIPPNELHYWGTVIWDSGPVSGD
ncbi:MAG TPA: YiiX/YebB-like N1pC/P60 family cysteine hydrolase [Holophagaceae bacterium]|nr:YiiX/YebB-like N1pC/P60 family cysteine hydrolase [Holophagaceae bacterium]